jgi:hypothetical protein
LEYSHVGYSLATIVIHPLTSHPIIVIAIQTHHDKPDNQWITQAIAPNISMSNATIRRLKERAIGFQALCGFAPRALRGSFRLGKLESGGQGLVLEVFDQAEAVVVEPSGQAVPVGVQAGERIVPRGPNAAFT